MCCGKRRRKRKGKAVPAQKATRWLGMDWAGIPLPIRIYAARQPHGKPVAASPGCGCIIRARGMLVRWMKRGRPWRKGAAAAVKWSMERGSWVFSFALGVWLMAFEPSRRLRSLIAQATDKDRPIPDVVVKMKGVLPPHTPEARNDLAEVVRQAMATGKPVGVAVVEHTRRTILAHEVARPASTSPNVLPSPSSVAALPVNASQRRTATSM